MSDVTQILENYMQLVKNFPVVFNGTKLKQTIENFGKKINLVQFIQKYYILHMLHSFFTLV